MGTEASLSEIHLVSTVLHPMTSQGGVTMLLNGLHVNTSSQALKRPHVGGLASRKREGREGFGARSHGFVFRWLNRIELALGASGTRRWTVNRKLRGGGGRVLPCLCPQYLAGVGVSSGGHVKDCRVMWLCEVLSSCGTE